MVKEATKPRIGMVTAEAVKGGYDFTAEQVEALHKFLGGVRFDELFGGAEGGVK